MKSRIWLLSLVVLLAFAAAPFSASATHSWGNYHWARTANPFTLQLGDNVSSNWDSSLATTSSDWSISSVLDTPIVAGGTSPRNCRPTSGWVEVCNSKYGNNGWLGIAGIWVSGSHITKGYVKVNDYYFNTATYNTPAWRNLVMCQEVGHTLGLDHQDENFNNANLGTCMHYTSSPGTNQHPNQHDYDQLVTIYTHLDSTTTIASTPPTRGNGNFETTQEWGQAVRTDGDGRPSLFERDFGGGHRLFTFVIWAR